MKKFVDSRDEAFIVIFFNSSIFFIKKFNLIPFFVFFYRKNAKLQCLKNMEKTFPPIRLMIFNYG